MLVYFLAYAVPGIIVAFIMLLICLDMNRGVDDNSMGIIVACGIVWPLVLAIFVCCVIMAVVDRIKERR